MKIDVREHRAYNPTLRCTGVRVDNLAISLQYARFQPFPDQAKKGTVVNAQPQHLKAPAMIHVVEKAPNVGFNHIAVASVLQVKDEVSNRIPCPAIRPVTITKRQKILLIDRIQYPGAGCLKEFVLDNRYS
jgi:hypothetical protein